MAANIIELHDAVVAYRAHVALRGVSLTVAPGEFVGIIGPNGAGKTTLLTVINGMAKLTRGRLSVFGAELTPANARPVRKRIGYLAQTEAIDARTPVSVRESVMLGRYGKLGLLHRPGKRDNRVVDEVLAMVGIAHLARRPIGQLSGGEQQRAAIARCLAQEPEIFLLDEPTASLDLKAQIGTLELVRQAHQAFGLTTICVTHDLAALPADCDRLVMMKDGMIMAEGLPSDLLAADNLGRLYDLSFAESARRLAERSPHR